MTDCKYNDNLCKQDDPVYSMRIEINALKAELAIYKAHQEPIGYLSPSGKFYKTRIMAVSNYEQLAQPVYASPVQTSPLTDEQIDALMKPLSAQPWGIGSTKQIARDFARAIEAAFRPGGAE